MPFLSGETESNQKKLVCGSTDDKLSEVGVAQAKAAGSELSNVNFDMIFSSDLRRAYDTAKAIADQGKGTKAVIQDPLLREKDFGRFEQMPSSEYVKLGTAAGLKTVPQIFFSVRKQNRTFVWEACLGTLQIEAIICKWRSLIPYFSPTYNFNMLTSYSNNQFYISNTCNAKYQNLFKYSPDGPDAPEAVMDITARGIEFINVRFYWW